MSITSKIVFVLGLLFAFLLIFFSGRANLTHYEKIQHSIEEIYEDRLVVKGFIFELSSLLHQKEIANISGDKSFYTHTNPSVNLEMEKLLDAFRKTKLTHLEKQTLDKFSEDFNNLRSVEKKITQSDQDHLSRPQATLISEQFRNLHNDLKTLSKIQLAEGKHKLDVSKRASKSMRVYARVENVMLLIFVILVLAIIFAIPSPNRDT